MKVFITANAFIQIAESQGKQNYVFQSDLWETNNCVQRFTDYQTIVNYKHDATTNKNIN